MESKNEEEAGERVKVEGVGMTREKGRKLLRAAGAVME